jgi:hypothetical protein
MLPSVGGGRAGAEVVSECTVLWPMLSYSVNSPIVSSTLPSPGKDQRPRPTNRRPLLCGKGIHSEYSSRLPFVFCNACVSMLTILLVICLPSLYSYTLFLCVSHSPNRYQPNKKELGSQFSDLSLPVRTNACTLSTITNTVCIMKYYVTGIVNTDIVRRQENLCYVVSDQFRN